MALDDDTRILSRVSLFEGFTTEQLRLLAFGAEPLTLKRGRILYRENDEADSAFVIVRGRIELFRGDIEMPFPAGSPSAGAILGALSLITESQRPTSAVAVVDTSLLRLARKTFRRILEEYPDLAVMLHRRIMDEFQTMVRDVSALAPRFGD